MATTYDIKPKFGRVLIKREVSDKIGSIIIPDAKRHAASEGIIVALGETAGWVEVPGTGYIQTMKVGDKVIFGKHSGTWLDATATLGRNPATGQAAYKLNDDGTLFMCQDADILAVLEDKPAIEKAA